MKNECKGKDYVDNIDNIHYFLKTIYLSFNLINSRHITSYSMCMEFKNILLFCFLLIKSSPKIDNNYHSLHHYYPQLHKYISFNKEIDAKREH